LYDLVDVELMLTSFSVGELSVLILNTATPPSAPPRQASAALPPGRWCCVSPLCYLLAPYWITLACCISPSMSEKEEKTPAAAAEEEKQQEDDEEEDLEKLQAEIERMEAEAARITKETEEIENQKQGTKTATAATAASQAKRDG
jgi:hypothetical protein